MDDNEVRAFFPTLSDLAPIGDPAGQKVVYGCRLADGRRCVLKLVQLPAPLDEDSEAEYNEAVARMRREIEILSSIHSPHVTRVADPSEGLQLCEIASQQCAYYFENLVDGPSVAALLAGGTSLTAEDVARLGVHVALAINEFWARGTVHRDVKPANIMREDATRTYVLLDAGYALDLTGPSLTRVAGIAGTLPYFSPERLDLGQKRQLDFRSDLYSLGIVMYEALSGRHPYITHGMGQDAQLQAVAHVASVKPAVVATGSEQLWKVVLRLLEKQPHARYRSCQLVVDELSPLQEGEP